MSPSEARRILGPDRIVGTFGGSEALVPGVLDEPADYFSIGPVGATRTKQTAKAPIGPEGVRRLRAEAGPGPVLVAAAGSRWRMRRLCWRLGRMWRRSPRRCLGARTRRGSFGGGWRSWGDPGRARLCAFPPLR